MEVNIDRLANVSLVCGIVSIFIFPMAFGGAAIIMGILVMERVETKDCRAYSNARLGIIFGIIGLALWLLMLAALNFAGFDMNSLVNLSGESTQAPAF